MMKNFFPGILTTTALCLAAGACVSCCNAAPLQAEALQRYGKPTHEEVRRKHIAQARKSLQDARNAWITCKPKWKCTAPDRILPTMR